MTIKNLALAAVAMCALSCTDFENGFDLTEYKYEQAFVDRFGEIDPNQNWGFGEMPVANNNVITRANVPEKNQWAKEMGLDVPGFPFADDDIPALAGKYMVANGNSYTIVDTPSSTDVPMGDVTDEEIEYVSKWFRSHRNPQSEVIHWTDFFVQNISHDKDRDAYPTWNPNTGVSGDWSGNVGNVIEKIYAKKDNNEYYTDGNGDKRERPINYGMEYFQVLTFDQNDVWDHILNFNMGISNLDPLSADANNCNRVIQYFRSSGTEDFEFQNTDETNGNRIMYNNYTIQHLVFTGASGKKYDGYYLGFDYECNIPEVINETNVTFRKEPDLYYNNWIVKITPAIPISTTPTDEETIVIPPTVRRVMCEDLGFSYDFDFNDIVFDVKYESTGRSDKPYDAIITLQAAGGTLPAYIGTKDSKHEVHNLFNVSVKEPVNVGKGTKSRPVAIFRLPVATTDPNEISVIVSDAANRLENLSSAEYNTLKSEKGNIPQKICVPGITGWALEETDIQEAYPFFNKWPGHINDADANDYKWTCAVWTNEEPYKAARVAATPVKCSYEYSPYNHKGAPITGEADVKQLIFTKDNDEEVCYNIWHSYKNESLVMGAAKIPSSGSGSGDITYTISLTKTPNEANGTINIVNPVDGIPIAYDHLSNGVKVRFTATCDPNYEVDYWEIDGFPIYEQEATVTVTKNLSVCAHFRVKKIRVTLNATPAEGGIVSGAGEYNNGEIVTISATPNTGYRFVKWSDDITDASRTITVTSDVTYTAIFESDGSTPEDLGHTYGELYGNGNVISEGLIYNHNYDIYVDVKKACKITLQRGGGIDDLTHTFSEGGNYTFTNVNYQYSLNINASEFTSEEGDYKIINQVRITPTSSSSKKRKIKK